MKIFISICLLMISINSFAAKKKEKKIDKEIDKEKVYQLKSDSSQIAFESSSLNEKVKPRDFWYVAFSRTGINYDVPSVVSEKSNFSNQLVGLTLGKKQENVLFRRDGVLEYSLEWQNYERTAADMNHVSYAQKMNLVKINLYQNFLLLTPASKSFAVSVGAGISPVVTTLEQSTLSNSSTDLGLLFSLKTNIDYPLSKIVWKDLSSFVLDLEMSFSAGEVGNRNMTMTSIKFGSNFNW